RPPGAAYCAEPPKQRHTPTRPTPPSHPPRARWDPGQAYAVVRHSAQYAARGAAIAPYNRVHDWNLDQRRVVPGRCRLAGGYGGPWARGGAGLGGPRHRRHRPARAGPRAGLGRHRRGGPALLRRAVAGDPRHGGSDHGGGGAGTHGVAGGGGLSAGGAGAGRARAARQPAADPARLAPAAACLAGPAVLGNAGRVRVARGAAVAAGAGAAPARTAAGGGAGTLDVPNHQGWVSSAKRDPADRRAVRPRPAGTAPGPEDRAECALLGGVRGAPGRTVAVWLGRADRRALDIGGDGAAGAGVLRIEVRAGGGAGGEVDRKSTR